MSHVKAETLTKGPMFDALIGLESRIGIVILFLCKSMVYYQLEIVTKSASLLKFWLS